MDELRELRAALAGGGHKLVGVDGMNGVGKTFRVARQLALPTVSLDDYLLGDGRYLEGFRLADLQIALGADDAPTIVVEGCCLLAVLEKVGLRPDLHVYARRIGAASRWEDEEVVLGDDRGRLLEELAHLTTEISRVMRTPKRRNTLEADLINYHADYRPFQHADLVLDLMEGGASGP